MTEWQVTQPGVIDGMPDDIYHADPVVGGSLSVSGAKLLLPPNCPALFKWRRDNGQPNKAVFDFGHAAHKEVLGVGQPIRYIQGKTAKGAPSDGWASKYAQEQQAEAYAAGEIPLLESQRGIIEGMVAALRAHPLASILLDPANGSPEQSLFWEDPESGVMLRGRLDFLPNPRNGRLLLVDYKTAASANPGRFAKSAADLNYHMQDCFYRDLAIGLGLDDAPSFLFIAQEKTPPYLVSVIELDWDAKAIGQQLNRQAIDIYQTCMESGEWPGYSSDVERVSLPRWYVSQHEQDNVSW